MAVRKDTQLEERPAVKVRAGGTANKPKQDGRRRVVIEGVAPEIDAGRFPAKRTIGDLVRVEADIFTDGHDSVAAVLLSRFEQTQTWTEQPMRPLVNDRWFGEFPVTELGRYRYTIHAWVDHWETWRRDLLKRIQANGDTGIDYLIGADLINAAAARAAEPDASWLKRQAEFLRGEGEPAERRTRAVDTALNDVIIRYPDRRFATEMDRELVIVVDPVRARFSSWYEFFPRSTAPDGTRHGTFTDCEARLAYIADMGFDVVYLRPFTRSAIHFVRGATTPLSRSPEMSEVLGPLAQLMAGIKPSIMSSEQSLISGASSSVQPSTACRWR